MLAAEQVVRLRQAASSARLVVFRSVLLSSGSPQSNKCHENVAAWIAENPDDKPVRGWLNTSGVLDKHSVVSGPDGRWFDVTPLRTKTPFFRHPGAEDEFWNLPNQIPIAALQV
jgi:hypothetical protein